MWFHNYNQLNQCTFPNYLKNFCIGMSLAKYIQRRILHHKCWIFDFCRKKEKLGLQRSNCCFYHPFNIRLNLRDDKPSIYRLCTHLGLNRAFCKFEFDYHNMGLQYQHLYRFRWLGLYIIDLSLLFARRPYPINIFYQLRLSSSIDKR